MGQVIKRSTVISQLSASITVENDLQTYPQTRKTSYTESYIVSVIRPLKHNGPAIFGLSPTAAEIISRKMTICFLYEQKTVMSRKNLRVDYIIRYAILTDNTPSNPLEKALKRTCA